LLALVGEAEIEQPGDVVRPVEEATPSNACVAIVTTGPDAPWLTPEKSRYSPLQPASTSGSAVMVRTSVSKRGASRWRGNCADPVDVSNARAQTAT